MKLDPNTLNYSQREAFDQLLHLCWYHKPSMFTTGKTRASNVTSLAYYLHNHSKGRLSWEAACEVAEVWFNIQLEIPIHDWGFEIYTDNKYEFLKACQPSSVMNNRTGLEKRTENIVLKGLPTQHFYNSSCQEMPDKEPKLIVVLEKIEINELIYEREKENYYVDSRKEYLMYDHMAYQPRRNCLRHEYTIHIFEGCRDRYELFQGEGI